MAGLRITTEEEAVVAMERFAAEVGDVLSHSILKISLLLGRKIAENVEAFKETVGTRRLSRSFLVPEPDGAFSFMLGAQSPIYARIHEYGGTIKPVHADYLVFETPDGEWHAVKEVHIREKRYARDALDEVEVEAPGILAAELTGAFG